MSGLLKFRDDGLAFSILRPDPEVIHGQMAMFGFLLSYVADNKREEIASYYAVNLDKETKAQMKKNIGSNILVYCAEKEGKPCFFNDFDSTDIEIKLDLGNAFATYLFLNFKKIADILKKNEANRLKDDETMQEYLKDH